MAAIDKTYVNKEQLLEAIKWAKEVGKVTLENGYEFNPLDWIEAYNDINDIPELQKMFCLWNTPIWFDRWLWLNCPLSFVRDRLIEVYDEESLKRFETYKYEKRLVKQKYTFLKVPNKRYWKWYANNMKRNSYWINKQAPYLIEIDDFKYDSITDSWNSEFFPMLPTKGFSYLWKEHHKHIPNKKSIIRQLRKWYIPSGTVVKVFALGSNRLTFKVLVK